VPELPEGPPPPDYEMSLEERGAQLAQYSREIEREQFWDTCRTLLACVAWSVSGAVGMGFSFASTDLRWAPVLFWGSLGVGYGGVAVALLSAYRRSLDRTGEW
jgi:hypothetical protein